LFGKGSLLFPGLHILRATENSTDLGTRLYGKGRILVQLGEEELHDVGMG